MYNRVVLIPYKLASESCAALKTALRDININTVKYKITNLDKILDTDLTIFWGCNTSPAANKLNFFKAAAEVAELNVPLWTESTEVAQGWIDDGITVFGRKYLTSHSGNGIIELEAETITTDKICPLYTQYKKKSAEYRVHVFNGSVIDIVQKKKRRNTENNSKIRNIANGWVYCREDVVVADVAAITKQALLACVASNLNFGAVDIIYNTKENKYYVLEVNTAPGMEGQTVIKYANAIKSYMEQHNG